MVTEYDGEFVNRWKTMEIDGEVVNRHFVGDGAQNKFGARVPGMCVPSQGHRNRVEVRRSIETDGKVVNRHFVRDSAKNKFVARVLLT